MRKIKKFKRNASKRRKQQREQIKFTSKGTGNLTGMLFTVDLDKEIDKKIAVQRYLPVDFKDHTSPKFTWQLETGKTISFSFQDVQMAVSKDRKTLMLALKTYDHSQTPQTWLNRSDIMYGALEEIVLGEFFDDDGESILVQNVDHLRMFFDDDKKPIEVSTRNTRVSTKS